MEFQEKLRLAEAAAKCGLIKSVEFGLVVMAYAESEGLHPAAGLREYKEVSGKPSLSAESMLARFQRSGGSVVWEALTDERAVAVFSHGDTSVRIEWDIDRARKAGLLTDRGGRPSMWKLYPRAMLRSRVVSEGVRTVFPGLVLGVYTPEEQEQIQQEDQAKPEPVSEKPKKAEASAYA
ncbi:MAG: recombinase RecT, partial [Casimicrobiaceae bacterium]